jgi:antitoxin YefM
MQFGYTEPGGMAMTTKEEHEGMSETETLHLLRTRANAERLLRSIENANAGGLTEHEVIEARPDAK